MTRQNKRSIAQQIELKHGKPLHQVLVDEYRKHGQKRIVAEALGVRPETVSRWIARFGLKTMSHMVKDESAG